MGVLVRGLGILLRNGTLPECWIPPGELRDQWELLRTRMALRDMRSKLKPRIHAAHESRAQTTQGHERAGVGVGRAALLAESKTPETLRFVAVWPSL